MLSLRPVGALSVEKYGVQPPLPLPHPSESSVVLVSGQRASEHDSFSGACNAKIVTPSAATDGLPAVRGGGGAAAAAGGNPAVATMVVGEGGKALLAQFLRTHSCLAIADVTRGLHRGFVRLRLAPPRPKGTAGGVRCMAGSLTRDSGLVFIGRAGIPALQAVRVDPWDALGSLSQPLGDAGPVLALACHPSRPVVAACLANGTIELWDYKGVDCATDGPGRFSGGTAGRPSSFSAGGRPSTGSSAGGRPSTGSAGGRPLSEASALIGMAGDGFLGAIGVGSPPSSPPRTRGASKGGKEDKIPVKPRLEGRLWRIATLSVQGIPRGASPADAIGFGFKSVSFHPAREWLCACTKQGLVGVWSLHGVVEVRPREEIATDSGAGAGGDEGAGGGSLRGPQVPQVPVRPFAARVVASDHGGASGLGNLSAASTGTTTVTCAFLSSEPVVMVWLSSASSTLSSSSRAASVATADDRQGAKHVTEPSATPGPSGSNNRRSISRGSSHVVLLSLLDAALPTLYSVMLPHAIAGLCVEARSGRIFASALSCGPSSAGVGAADGRSAMVKGSAMYPCVVGSGVAKGALGGVLGFGGDFAVVGGWRDASRHGEGGAGVVNVLALASGSFLDRGHSRVLHTTMEVPPTVFLEGVFGTGDNARNQQQQQQPLLPLPLQVYFLRSMAVLIRAGPGGGVDIPAVKAVLHAQGLERDKGLKDRSKPRRLASLPGHTDDLLKHARGDESSPGYPAGHLMPYRLAPGPLLRLAEAGTGAREERRRFLVLYEIIASRGSNLPLPTTRDAALSEPSRTVCGLVTPAGYGEAHGRYENEAQLSHLFPATDACFVSTSGQGEPSALLIEGGGYLAAVYSVPDMHLRGRKALSLPVTRVLATPDCLGSQRGKVLYVVRSPRSPSDFLETMVYSDRGGLQCPEPLLPVKVKQKLQGVGGDGGGVTSSAWGGGRPYANAHLVLEANERVMDAKFQPLRTVAELSAWGYREQQSPKGGNTSSTSTGSNASAAPVPMLAVLTTRRILVLSAPRLTPVAEAWGLPPRNGGSVPSATGGLSVWPTSVAWAGSSVVCTLEDGRVVYLNPGDGMESTPYRAAQEPDVPERGAGAGGASGGGNVSSPWRPLCSVDRRLCAGGIGIAACLPDRLCLVVRGGAGGGITHLVTRPLFPLEPLVAGVLASSGSAPPLPLPSRSSVSMSTAESARGMDAATLDLLRRLVARYAPPRTRLPRGTNPGDGPGLGAGASCAAFLLLSRHGLHVLAAEVAGMNWDSGSSGNGEEMNSRSADVFMRRRPWISPLERSRCAAKLNLPLTAMMEAIGDDPALADTCADPDAITSALLPAVGSSLSRTALALAEQSDSLGLHDAAARLLDISGDDARLDRYLAECVQPHHPSNPGDLLHDEPLGDGAVAAAAAAQLKALRSTGEPGRGSIEPDYSVRGEALEDEGGATAYARVLFRHRTSLLAEVPRLPQVSAAGLEGRALEAAGGGEVWKALLKHAKPEEGLRLGVGTGVGGVGGWPPSCTLRPLALHSAEQWSGRARPECLEVNNTAGGGNLSMFATAAAAATNTASTKAAVGSRSSSNTVGSASTSATAATAAVASSSGAPDNTLSVRLDGGEARTLGEGEDERVAAEREGDGTSGAAWVAVGGSWRDEENVCGYWRFSEGAGGAGPLEEGKQLQVRDLSKYGCSAVVKGRGLRLEDTTSPVDPGDTGKVAEAVDVCFPDEVGDEGNVGNVGEIGGYGRGVFVRALRGSSIDVGLFHEDQRRSVTTFEAWFNAGEKPLSPELQLPEGEERGGGAGGGGQDEGDPSRQRPQRFRQEFHVVACRVSSSGQHVWSLVVENNGQVAFIPGPAGRRDLGPGFAPEGAGNGARIAALKEAVYTEAGAFRWDGWTHVAVTMDTSRDESSAEVKLFLDGNRVGQGTCRFNKVPQSCLAETWMVIGPDLTSWKLTEARLWAMLRDEESLQDWKDNSLALAETRKNRLVIRAVSKAKANKGSATAPASAEKLAGPPGTRASFPAAGKLAPPPAAGSSAGTTAARRRLIKSPPLFSGGGDGVGPTPHGGGMMLPPLPTTAGRPGTRTSDLRRASHDPRKAAMFTGRQLATPLAVATPALPVPPPSSSSATPPQQPPPTTTAFATVAGAVDSPADFTAFADFASFTAPAAPAAPAPTSAPEHSTDAVGDGAATRDKVTIAVETPPPGDGSGSWREGSAGETAAAPDETSGKITIIAETSSPGGGDGSGCWREEPASQAAMTPEAAAPQVAPEGVEMSTAMEATTPTRTDVSHPTWSAFNNEARASAELATPTISEASSIVTPLVTPRASYSQSWSAFGDDVALAAAAISGGGGSKKKHPFAVAAGSRVVGKKLFESGSSTEPSPAETAEATTGGAGGDGEELDTAVVSTAAGPQVTAESCGTQEPGEEGDHGEGAQKLYAQEEDSVTKASGDAAELVAEGSQAQAERGGVVLGLDDENASVEDERVREGGETTSMSMSTSTSTLVAKGAETAEGQHERFAVEVQASTRGDLSEAGKEGRSAAEAKDTARVAGGNIGTGEWPEGGVEGRSADDSDDDDNDDVAHDPNQSTLPHQVSPTKIDPVQGTLTWRGKGSGSSEGGGDSAKGWGRENKDTVAAISTEEKLGAIDDASSEDPSRTSGAGKGEAHFPETPSAGDSQPTSPDGDWDETLASEQAMPAVTTPVGHRLLARVEVRSVVLAGPESVVSSAEAAAAHVKSPLLGSNAKLTSVLSSKGGINTIAVTDLGEGGSTTRYPIGCISASISPRVDEQMIALLSKADMQVFSITHKVRQRYELMKESNVRLWRWLSDDVIAIVSKDEVLTWNTREHNSTPTTMFKRHRPHDPSAPPASRAVSFDATEDGRWGLLAVADSERVCDVCESQSDATEGECSCETSLMIDLHDFSGFGRKRCFRALGVTLLDSPRPHPANLPASATGSQGEPFPGVAESSEGPAWNEPLLVATIPEDETPGVHTLRLSSLDRVMAGRDDHCLCSADLGREEVRQATGNCRMREYLRQSGVAAVPYHVLLWRPVAGPGLLALITLAGGLTLFQIEADAASLTAVYRDPEAFPGAVTGAKVDTNGEMVVLSAGVGDDQCWVISRAAVSGEVAQ